MAQTVLEFREVIKRFGTLAAVDQVSFSIEPGEIYTLLGPSGCGKTTTLRLVAGLEEPDDGEILVNGTPVAAPRRGVLVAPDKRALGMVFQSYAIWPQSHCLRKCCISAARATRICSRDSTARASGPGQCGTYGFGRARRDATFQRSTATRCAGSRSCLCASSFVA